MPPRIAWPRLRERLAALAAFGRDPDGRGITRPCWGRAYEEARSWLLEAMKAAGLTTWVDPAGNTFGLLPISGAARSDAATGPRPGPGGAGFPDGPPVVLTGSHIDTVPHGGPLDGALGVLAGLECLETIGEAGLPLRRPLAVAAWSDEEGRYGSLFGSRAFTGRLDAKRLPHLAAADGERLADAMARAGFDLGRAPEARCDPRRLAAYVELHIEQGPHLEAAGVPIGVVEGIVGIRRFRLTFRGQADHAGTTPMAWRRDAFLGAADYALRAREHVVRRGSGRSVTNFGRVELAPGVSNIVPEQALLLQEIRELDARTLSRLDRQCRALARAVARRRGLGLTIEALSRTEPTRCAPAVMRAVAAAAEGLGLAWRRMPSAAGHDAQNLARVTPTGMLFIPSRGGRSHRPDERSDPRAIERGANVLLHTLLRLAGG